tara:strand:+ start:145 stop:495 length:351 start_codon:yes stop_codon:yes gene_type:complete
MNKIFFAAMTLTTALWTPAAFSSEGGSCHFHGHKTAAEATVSGCAAQRKAALVKNGKLEVSWTAVKQEKIEVIEGKKAKEWKVTFKDAAAKEKSKETLYMFFSMPGNFIASNFTGQ